MPQIEKKADAFHQAIVAIIVKGYERKEITNKAWKSNDAEHQKSLERFSAAIEVWQNQELEWLEPSYTNGKPAEDYKNALLSHIKETLVALHGVLKHGDIFLDQEKHEENGRYQKIMSVLKTPRESEALLENDGLFYKDMVDNERYWNSVGSHVQLMRNLSEVLVTITDISLSQDLENKREDAQVALSTVFSEKLFNYGVCPGGHADNIRVAKDMIPISPQELLLAKWHKYVDSLIAKPLTCDPNSTIVNEVFAGNHVHLPPAIDYLAGVPKDVILPNEKGMFIGIDSLKQEHSVFLIDSIFDFPKFLIKEIDSLLEGFDKLTIPKKNEQITELYDRFLKRLEKPNQQDDFKHSIFNVDLGTFYPAITIREKAIEKLSSLLSCTLGIDQISKQELANLDVSDSKRIACIPKEEVFLNIQFLGYALSENRVALNMLTDACPIHLKVNMFSQTMAACATNWDKEALMLVQEICPENIRNKIYGQVVNIVAKMNNERTIDQVIGNCSDDLKIKVLAKEIATCALINNRGMFKKIKRACPSHLRVKTLARALAICAAHTNEEAIDMIVTACPPDQIETMFVRAIAHCKEKVAFDKVLQACPIQIIKPVLIGSVLFHAKRQNEKNLTRLTSLFSSGLITNIFPKAMASCAIIGHLDAFARLNKICPSHSKETILKQAEEICLRQGHQGAADRIRSVAIQILIMSTPINEYEGKKDSKRRNKAESRPSSPESNLNRMHR